LLQWPARSARLDAKELERWPELNNLAVIERWPYFTGNQLAALGQLAAIERGPDYTGSALERWSDC
jgi:hypothetical protein